MGLKSPASGRETETMVASGNSSKIGVATGRGEISDDAMEPDGSVCIWTYRGIDPDPDPDPEPDTINCSEYAIFYI